MEIRTDLFDSRPVGRLNIDSTDRTNESRGDNRRGEKIAMGFEQSERSHMWMERVRAFMDAHIIPAVPVYHRQLAEMDRWAEIPPVFKELKARAKVEGLWNFFMP